MRYAAFISYNYRDRRSASWLHRALETYRVPKYLQGRQGALGVIGARLPPIFQDREELATSSDLVESVREALEQSATLIVICSPNAAKSRWVNEEIRTFVALGRRHRIECLIIDGIPNAAQTPGASPDLECLPPALFEHGGSEPLAADIRRGGDHRNAAKLKILAAILGVGFDELRQREQVRRQRQLAAIAAGSAAGFVTMSALAVVAVVSRNEAIHQRDVARQKTLTAERTVGFVKSMFEVADPSQSRGETITAREILDRGARDLDQGLQSEPAVKADLSTTLGEVYTGLGLLNQGEAMIQRALRTPGIQPDARARQYLALAETKNWLGDDAAAASAYRAALRMAREQADGSPDLISRSLSGLGNEQTLLGATADGEANIRAAMALHSKQDPSGVEVAQDLERLAHNALVSGRLDLAKEDLERALAIRTRRQGPLHPIAVQDVNELGSVAYQKHDSLTAARRWNQALSLNERLLGPDHPGVATSLNNVALIKIEARDYRGALPLMKRAVAINAAQKGQASGETVFYYTNLGLALRGVGDAVDATAAFETALDAARLRKHRNLAPILVNLADLACDRGDLGAGTRMLNEAAPLMASTYPKDPWRSAWVETIRGNCLLSAGRAAEALRVLQPATAIIASRWPPGTHYAARAEQLLARARART